MFVLHKDVLFHYVLCLWNSGKVREKYTKQPQDSSGLYYKRIPIVIGAPSVVSKWRSKL
jgi:hypothetical protein